MGSLKFSVLIMVSCSPFKHEIPELIDILIECGSNSTSNVDSGEFSSISLVVNRDSSLRCTASIISPLWALTSSSCVNQPNQEWILIAGNTELNMSKISKNSVISLIGNIVSYPEVSCNV